jgi:hypothetical protein
MIKRQTEQHGCTEEHNKRLKIFRLTTRGFTCKSTTLLNSKIRGALDSLSFSHSEIGWIALPDFEGQSKVPVHVSTTNRQSAAAAVLPEHLM